MEAAAENKRSAKRICCIENELLEAHIDPNKYAIQFFTQISITRSIIFSVLILNLRLFAFAKPQTPPFRVCVN